MPPAPRFSRPFAAATDAPPAVAPRPTLLPLLPRTAIPRLQRAHQSLVPHNGRIRFETWRVTSWLIAISVKSPCPSKGRAILRKSQSYNGLSSSRLAGRVGKRKDKADSASGYLLSGRWTAGPRGPAVQSVPDKDNRAADWGRPAMASVWLRRFFSRPGLQEPKEGLPGPAGENPSGRSREQQPRAVFLFRWRQKDGCRERRGPICSPKG